MPNTRPSRTSRILIKALLGTGGVVTFSIFLLGGLFLLRHQRAFQRELELRAEVIAKAVAGQSQFALLVENQQEMDRTVQAALESSDDVLFVAIENPEGKLVSLARRPAVARDWLVKPQPARPNVQVVVVEPSRLLCVEADVTVVPQSEAGLFNGLSAPSEELGRIRVGMSLESQRALFRSTLRYVLGIAFCIAAVALVVQYLQFRRLLTPVAELAKAVRRVAGGEYQPLVGLRQTDDEIGVLVGSFNDMVEQIAQRNRDLHDQVHAKERARSKLASAQQSLIQLSRQAGMAEVASGVLHNVGNALNSVSVSANLVETKVKESRVDKWCAIMEMVERHHGNLDSFFREDAKGQRVLPYLAKLAVHFQQERTAILQEIELLSDHLGHIRRIVSTQQNYARMSGVIEDISLADLAEDALRMLGPSIEKRDIMVLRDFGDLPTVATDKHQVLQILLNLLRNAGRAVEDSGRSERVIRVRIRRREGDRVALEVTDSGVGLSAEYVTRIFSHGFTTKVDGHGFGLHSGALAAQQLGGSLRAESDGPGHGARFTLELPLNRDKHPEQSIAHDTYR